MISRRGIVVMGGLGAAALAAGILLTPEGEQPGRFTSGTLAYPDLTARLAQAARIEIIAQSGRVTLLRGEPEWAVEQVGGYPARPARLRELLTALTELRLIEERTSDPALQARLGVDDPGTEGSTATLLRLLDGEGRVMLELILGTRRTRPQANVPDTLYVRRVGEARAWLAEGRILADADPQLWVDREIAVLAPDRLRRVEVQRAGEPPLALARAGEVDAPLMIVTPEDAPPTDVGALEEVGRAFDMLTFTDVRRATPQADGEADGEALGEARFTYTDEVNITVWPRREDGHIWVTLRAEGGPEAQALQARWDGWAYQLGQWKEAALIPRLEDLLAR